MRNRAATGGGRAGRILAWLATGAPGRGLAFAVDLAAAVRRGLAARYR